MATSPSSRMKTMRGLVDRWLGRAEAVVDEDVPVPDARDVDREATAQRVAAEQLAQNRSKSTELPAGRQFVVPFERAMEHFGDRWPKLINRAKLFAQNALERRLGDRFALREDGDEGVTFVILDEDLSEADIELLGAALIETIERQLIGGDDVDEPNLSGRQEAEAAEDEAAPQEVPVEAAAPIATASAEAVVEEQEPAARFRYDADQAEPDFADGWEFTEGPETESDAGVSDDLATPDLPVVAGSGDAAEDDLSIPLSTERAEAEAIWAASADIEDPVHETPLAGDREVPAQDGEFISDEPAQQVMEFVPSSALPDEALSIPTADDRVSPEFETPIAGDRLEAEYSIPISGDLDAADEVILSAATGDVEPATLETPIADLREASEAAFSSSEDRVETVSEFAATDTRAEAEFDVPTSGNIAQDQAEFGQSETRGDGEWDVPVSSDMAAPEQADFASSETVAEDAAAVVVSEDRAEAPLGDFGQSETRAEDPAVLTTASDDHDDQQAMDFGQSETTAEPVAEFTASEDRDAAPQADFGISETRADDETVSPVSGERDDAPDAEFGQSATRQEAEYDVPLSADREQPGMAEFGRSETKGEPVYDVPTSEDRASASANAADFGRSETREEAEFDVPVSHDREEAPPADFGRSETRVEGEPREIEVEQTGERAERDVTLVAVPRLGPAAVAPTSKVEDELPFDDVRLRYGAWLDTRSDVVTTYLADPCTRRFDGTETPYHFLLGDGPSPERCFMLDCLMLQQAMAQIAQVMSEGGQLIVGLPVAATTLARPKFRAEYLRLFRLVDEGLRKMTRLVAYQLPQTSASQASDLFGWLRSIARPPIVRIPPRSELLAPLSAHGAYGISINHGKWESQLGELPFAKRLQRIVEQAHLLNLRVAATNLPNKKAIEIAIAIGVDLIEIKVLQNSAAIPRRLVKVDRAALFRSA